MRKLVAITILTVLLLAACSSKDTSFKYSDLPAGNANNGAALFTQSVNGELACSGCHNVTGAAGAGPTLKGFALAAGSRVKGESAQDYAFYSILRPSKYLVSGFSNIMPTDYETKLSRQNIADLIAYLMTQGGTGTTASAASGGGGTSVDTTTLVLRLVHIFAGAFWFGAGMFMILFFEPTLKRVGIDAQKFIQAFLKKTRFAVAMPVSAALTTLAGLALYYRVSGHFNADWMKSTAGVVLSIGAVSGLLAFLHGGAVVGPNTIKMTRLVDEIDKQGTPPSDEQTAALTKVEAQAHLHGWVSALLIIVAMGCMISARYL